MKVAAVVNDSTADGPGTRFLVFVSHGGAQEITTNEVEEVFRQNPELTGITISGADPFDQALDCAKLAIAVKHVDPKFTVWIYTGYKFEEILQCDRFDYNLLLSVADVLVDGPFVESLRSDKYNFKLSTNQRIIDTRRSLAENKISELVVI